MFVVCVSFEPVRQMADDFLALVRRQADLSVRNEAGCRRFDVCVADDGAVFLYEHYTEKAAFDAHLQSAHFLDFDRQARDLVQHKVVHTYHLAHEGGHPDTSHRHGR